jgi:tol-pal system protein YbgF
MGAGRGLAVSSLLAVIFIFSGCGVYREYVRRGALLDSIARQLTQIEQEQESQRAALSRLRADELTALEQLQSRIGEFDADLIDINERIERIGRRVGAWRGELVAENHSPPETATTGFDTAIAGIDPDKIYNTAYLDFTRGNYQLAITGFRRFIQLFPTSEMADNAQYWIGECFYSLNQLDSAIVEFKRVMEKYPNGNKIPAALYKLGLVYQLQNKNNLAREQFTQIINNYPASPEAKLAEEKLKINYPDEQ